MSDETGSELQEQTTELEQVQPDEVQSRVGQVVPANMMEMAEQRGAEGERALEMAEGFEVETQEDAEQADEMSRRFRETRLRNKDVLEPFIRPLREHLDELYALRRAMTDSFKDAEKKLDRKVVQWRKKKERERQKKLEEERRKREEEARRRREQEALEAAEQGDEERFDQLSEEATDEDATAAAVTPEEAEEMAPEPKVPEGSHVQTRWKARLAGETKEAHQASLRKLAKAVAEGRAPASLLSFDGKAGNSLAKATEGELKVPGVEFYKDERLVKRRR